MISIDPRVDIINRRLSDVDRVIVVASGKGGVGKSLISTGLALALGEKGYRVGLLDLDFYSPSTHVILGVSDLSPVEEKGLMPPVVKGLSYMSLFFFIGDKPAPFKGKDVTNAILELLGITRWGSLDYLIIDMPPGTGEEILDVTRFISKSEFIVVSTPSKVAFNSVKKLLLLLKEMRVKVIGLLENMSMDGSSSLKKEVESLGITYIDYIIFDMNIEEAIGKVDSLYSTRFMDNIRRFIDIITNMI
ncbi:MAG: P-loop NTPase [Candidatus Thermoplasmatota archaeon]